jgi:release factor glutamine methyltransferase
VENRIGEAGVTPERWTVLSLLDWAGQYLKDHGFDEARLHVELLLAHVLDVSRLELYLQFDRPLIPVELQAFKGLFKRRLTHEPLQYILGETEFMGLSIEVDRNVLIPRPETEGLVERALAILKHLEGEGAATVVDIGTGSGNIAIAVGHYLPAVRILAVDISGEALRVAERNVRKHALANVRLKQLDIMSEPLPDADYSMVVSNPPYVSLSEFGGLEEEVRIFEPRLATTDGGNGMTILRRILEVSRDSLQSQGWVLLELGFDQSVAVRGIAEKLGFVDIQIVPDLAGIPRVFCARRPS